MCLFHICNTLLHLPNTSDTDTTISSFSKVLRNDVMSHARTMESLHQAGRGLLEVGSGDSPHGLQSRLEQLNENWEFVRCETERRQLELENRLSQVMTEPTVCSKCMGCSMAPSSGGSVQVLIFII